MNIPVNMSDISPDEPLDLNRDHNDRAYWRSRTPAERWACMMHLNRLKYGDEAFNRPMEKVLRQLTWEEFNKEKEEEYEKEKAEEERRASQSRK